jgi:hypothetical protein
MTPGVCICIPSRGRKESLERVVTDMVPKCVREDTYFVVAMDADDPEQDHAWARGKSWVPMPRIGFSIAPRESTIGARYDRCLKLVPGAALYIPHADDSVILEFGFDQTLMDAISLFPDHVGMVEFPGHGAGYEFGFGIGGGMARLFNTIGVPCFPYWWEETWWGEVGRLSGKLIRRESVNMVPLGAGSVAEARSIAKTTTGLRDVAWWAEFFDRTRPIRINQACDLIAGDAPYRQEQIKASWPLQCDHFREVNKRLRDPVKAARWEAEFKGASGVDEARYQKTKAEAEAYLKERGL